MFDIILSEFSWYISIKEMSSIKNNNKRLAYKEYEPPTKKIISAGDILIKELVNKQQKRDINLQEYLMEKQNFEKVSTQISISCAGTLPLENFKVALQQFEQIQDLKACNLTDDDVKLITDYRDGKLHDKYRNVEPTILQIRIENILQVISEYQKKSTEDCDDKQRNISHKQNEALALKPLSIETKLLKFALENKNDFCEKLPHPMDTIKDLENNLFSHLGEKNLSPLKIKKQLRRYANKGKTNRHTVDISNSDCVKKTNPSFVSNSKWDQVEQEHINVALTNSVPKTYTSNPKNFYTVKNGEIVVLNLKSTENVDVLTRKQFTIEEIKAIPKFKNYTVGTPSNTLYLKNLPKLVQEIHLRAMFCSFVSASPSYKIMNGRMKGQAFVTFPDVDTASKALDEVNGTVLFGKPIVIEFGKN